MMNRLLLGSAVGLVLLAGFAACSSSDDGVVGGFTPDSGGNAPQEGGTSAEGGGHPDGGGGGTYIPKPTACPAANYKTLVVVGDSISDVGGGGGGAAQEPFYPTLLVKNHDTLYPEWKG